MFQFLFSALTLVIIVGALTWDSSRFLGRFTNAAFNRFPRAGSFAFGALFGVYAGLIPALIVYAVIRRGWAAELVDGSMALACGIGWARVGEGKRSAANTRKGSAN
jgi:hypothetical protein